MKRRALLMVLCCSLFLSGCGRVKAMICSLTGREANERVLKQDLFSLRSSIDNYTTDKAKAPQSLDDLVEAGYLRAIPKDPMTGKSEWVPMEDDSLMSPDQTATGISDLHSASQRTACDGTAYSSW